MHGSSEAVRPGWPADPWPMVARAAHRREACGRKAVALGGLVALESTILESIIRGRVAMLQGSAAARLLVTRRANDTHCCA